MKKWLPALLLLLFSGAAWASAANPSIYSDAVANKTDISIAYLSSIFGSVSGVLNGTSGQMLGKLMYQFNQGLLVVAGCWLGFSVLTMVFKSAVSGSFMQQDNKVPMILLRIAFGFGLLIPNPSTGYTLLQGIVMQVVVQGVKLANQVWDYGLDYMNAGGALWSRPVQQKTSGDSMGSAAIVNDNDSKAILGDKNNNRTNLDSFDELGFVQKIMAMEACMVQSSINADKDANSSSTNDSGGITVNGSTSSTSFSVYEDLDNFKFEFPGGYSTQNSNGGRNTACGVVYWSSVNSSQLNLACNATPPTDGSPTDDNTQCGFTRLAVQETINTLLPAVKKWVCINNGLDSGSVCSGIDAGATDTSYMSDAMMGAMLNYVNLIKPLARKDVAGNGGTAFNFYDQAKKDGWMTAGRYYWDLLRVENAYDEAVSSATNYRNYIPNNYGDGPDTATMWSGVEAKTNELLTATPAYITTVNSDVQAFTGAASSGQTGPAQGKKTSGMKWLLILLFPLLAEMTSLITSFSASGPLGMGPEPILWLHNIGMNCLSLGGNIWIGIALALFPAYMISNVCAAVNPIGYALKGVMDWLQPVFLMLGAAFFAVGISLGYYLPLYPYMLFTFGVIGWLIMVIEAMVAAPLVAMGITHPEGHDFLGRSQQALMLLISVFLRPVLMVIGLFAAMILCQVSLSIVLYTFAGFVSDIFYVHTPIGGAPGGDILLNGVGLAMGNVMAGGGASGFMILFMPLIVFPLFLCIFTLLVYTVTTTCFSLIHHLPDYVGSWIGIPQSHAPNAQQMAEKVGHGVSGGAQKAADATGKGLGHAAKKSKEKQTPDTLNVPEGPA